MPYLFTLLTLLMFGLGCRNQDAVLPLDTPVTSFADLPITYQQFQGGSAVPGRLKSETQNGKSSGEWRYNERGQLIEWRLRFDAVESAVQYRYDKDGHLRYVQQFSNNCGYSSVYNCSGPVAWTSYDELTTDTAGRVTESRTYLKLDGNWDFRNKSVYAYDAQGKITNVLRYDAKGVLGVTQTLTYDSRANIVAIREQNASSPDLSDRTFTYEYDTGRNPYVNTVYYPSALFLSRNMQLAPGLTYEYRSDGLPIRIRQNGGNTELTYY